MSRFIVVQMAFRVSESPTLFSGADRFDNHWILLGFKEPKRVSYALARFGPTRPLCVTRSGVRLAAIGKGVRRASHSGEFHDRQGHTPFDLLFRNPISRFGDGPRGLVAPRGWDVRRRSR